MKSFFTKAQWRWMAERNREGYNMGEIARFLGVHRETVRRGLVRMGYKPDSRALPPLSDRKQEFLALAEE